VVYSEASGHEVLKWQSIPPIPSKIWKGTIIRNEPGESRKGGRTSTEPNIHARYYEGKYERPVPARIEEQVKLY